MGAKTWMLVYADDDARRALAMHPTLDREATSALASALFPDEPLQLIGEGDLSNTSPARREIRIGCFGGVCVVSAKAFALDYPSKLPTRFLTHSPNRKVFLHAMHSTVDWFAYAYWDEGKLIRSLSVSPDGGTLEDIGERLPFEEPYWSGRHPVVSSDEEGDAYPLPFHPLELAEAALAELFGYQLEGFADSALLEPQSIPLLCFRRRGSWWKFWL